MPLKQHTEAALAGDTRYPPTDGTPALRAAIARKFKRDNDLTYDVSQITLPPVAQGKSSLTR